MKIITVRNVNEAYYEGINLLYEMGVHQPSRVGEVIVYPTPVTTVYQRPRERVLFDARRDANPFFHFFEALWMLAGRNDARWLDLFVKDFSARFAEDDGRQHGAYGYRWRKHFDLEWGGHPQLPDQLAAVIGLLKKNPDDRRVVLSMWDPPADLCADKRDVPCNTHIYLRVRREPGAVKPWQGSEHCVLDMTVCCRSNDAIWGAYGANAVHFSVLQEYLAAMIDAEVGTLYQISNNFHMYVAELGKHGIPETIDDLYGPLSPQRMISNPAAFDRDLQEFMVWTDQCTKDEVPVSSWVYSNEWFTYTAAPLFEAAWWWRAGKREIAYEIVTDPDYALMAADWSIAAQRWMKRRMEKHK